MVIDSSVLVAIFLNEPDGPRFDRIIGLDANRAAGLKLSVVSLVETSMVLESRLGFAAAPDLNRYLELAGIAMVDVDRRQAAAARDAWRRFGKGRHPAALNLGECFAYALARSSGEPLLYKGRDFALTDIQPATA